MYEKYILSRNEGSLSSAGNVELDETSDLEVQKEDLLGEQCFLNLSKTVSDAPDQLMMELDELAWPEKLFATN